jgi:glycerol-3-phosphate dehydrogenase
MRKILRNPKLATKETYDLVIIGGGIYGVMLTWEASLRGLQALLIEKADFGAATSFNSLKTIHGGFRYLQSLNLQRFSESVRERNWFLQNFSESGLVQPLSCLLPLYGKGLRRAFILQQALHLNNILASRWNHYLDPKKHLPKGKIISPQLTQEIFSLVNLEGLQGAAIWYDAFLPNSQRLIIEVLKAACSMGATALNYMEAQAVLSSDNRVAGLIAQDRETGTNYEYRTRVIVNAAGPWSEEVAINLDRKNCNLYKNCLAWNVSFDRTAVSEFAVAVAPNRVKAKTYLIHNWQGKLLVGTGNAPCLGKEKEPMPSDSQLEDFIADINDAVPQLKLNLSNVEQIWCGFRPVKIPQTIAVADREMIISHEKHGGYTGLYSISGVKFTTARLVAEKTLKQIFANISVSPPQARIDQVLEGIPKQLGTFAYDWYPKPNDLEWQQPIKNLITEESVEHLDDLIFRRTSLGDNPTRARALAPEVCKLFNWDAERSKQELLRTENYLVSREVNSSNICLGI